MTTKNLVINNELGSFTFNEETLCALDEFLTFVFPLANDDLHNRLALDKKGDLERSYYEHIEREVKPLVRKLSLLIHHS